MGDLVCDNDSSQLTNNYISSLSAFSFVTEGQVPTIYLFGTTIEDNYLKNETFIKENVFIEVPEAWMLEVNKYPGLAVFTKE